ncbi:MAG: pseudomurein-binding repeat-containing protein [Methanobacteriaceae archaeon]
MNVKKLIFLFSCLVLLIMFMGVVSAATLNETEMKTSSSAVKNYTASNSKLPNYVQISNKNSSMPSYLYSLVNSTLYLNKSSKTAVTIKSVGAPSGPSGTATGTLTKAQYLTVAQNIQNYINTNGVAPNYASSTLGNIRYESLIYAYARIVDYYYVNGVLPNSVTITQISGVNSAGVIIDNMPPTITNSLASGTYNTTKTVTLAASDTVDTSPKVYYSINNGAWVNAVKTATITLSSGTTTLKYYAIDNKGNPTANYTATYTISIPVTTNNTTSNIKFSKEDLGYIASFIVNYVEYNHELPKNVTHNGICLNISQVLKLFSIGILNINGSNNSSIVLENVSVSNSFENISKSGTLNKSEYLKLASDVKNYISSNTGIPISISTKLGNISYYSLVYTFAQVFYSYQTLNSLPNFITVLPWNLVSNNRTVFLSMGDIIAASSTLVSHVESQHNLPSFIIISEHKIKMSDFLKLSTMSIINLNGSLIQSLVLGNFSAAPNSHESITGGNLLLNDYLVVANSLINFMDANGAAPNYATSVRGYISYESLVYIYAQLLVSANKNNVLPNYITLVPWSTVQNSSTTFISMDLIKSMAFYVKNYVEVNHTLPSSLNLSGVMVNMNQFLMLEIVSLKNIKDGLYQSIILKNYSNSNSPSESLKAGKINFDNYFNAIDNIISFMNTNNQAPNYVWVSQGNMSYQNLVFTYAIILNYYNSRGSLPEYVSVNPWSVISNTSTVSFSETQIMEAAEFVEYYIEANHVLPNNVSIGGYSVTMPQFLKVLVTTLHNLNGTYAGQIILGSYGYPTSYSETTNGGILDQVAYLDLARSIEFFMFDGRAPNFQNSSIGNIRYDSLIYMYSQILSSIKKTGKLPDFIVIEPWKKVSNSTNSFVSVGEVVMFSNFVKYYIENRHSLPTDIKIANFTISMPQYLKLLSNSLDYISGGLRVNILIENYNAPINTLENIKPSIIDDEFYISLANNVSSYIRNNSNIPPHIATSLGNISYQSLIYTFSSILSYYFNTSSLPDNYYFNNWSVVSNNNTKFVSINDILWGSKFVADYIEKFHTLPSSVVINGSNLTMGQFLNLAAMGLININNGFDGRIPIIYYSSPVNISENINQSFGISISDLIDVTSSIMEFMDINGRAPDYQNSSFGKVGFNSLVYMYSQALRSYLITNKTSAFVNIISWNVISNSTTVFVSMEQLKNASNYIKSYIDSNHVLPISVFISGVNISMDEFLKLSSKAVIFIKNDINTCLILDRLTPHNITNVSENITKGDIYYDEILEIADYVLSYSNNNSKTPFNFVNSTLGSVIGFESLVYIFANVMSSYSDDNGTISDQFTVLPWLAVSNPNKTYNFRNNEFFNSLQEAINSNNTISGDTLWLSNIKYIENIILNKQLTINSLSGDIILIQSLNHSSPVFTINGYGNGSLLQNLWINGSTNSSGIFINKSSNNTILENKVTNNFNGIEIWNSSGNILTTNNISNNTANGISIYNSSLDEIAYNNMSDNGIGLFAQYSNKGKFYDNIISNNNIGVYLKNSSCEGHYNLIFNNNQYGFYSENVNNVNFTNNWWGSNNPTVSSVNGSDIYINGGNVSYDPYLVLRVSTSTNRSTWNSTYYDYLISADLSFNSNGEDCSPYGNIPDDLIIYFESTNGNITNSANMTGGKSKVKVTNTTSGSATINVSFLGYSINKTFNVLPINVTGIVNNRTGEQFGTIQDAINSVNTRDGDVIRVSEGSYYENVIINKKITLEAVSGEKVYLYPDKINQNTITITSSGSGSMISGFNIVGFGESYGISLTYAYGCIIKNNNISGFDQNIYLYCSGNNTIQNNNIFDSIEGISLIASNNNRIIDNRLISNENGINLQNSHFNTLSNNELVYNYYAISIRYSDNIQILNNKLINNWVGVYLFKTDSNRVIGNNFTENGAGLSLYNAMATFNSSNYFKDNWLADFSVIDDSEMVMASTVYSCGPAALATLFKKWGMFISEEEIAKLAGTDNTGTSLWGLKNASESKGIPVNAYNVTMDKLKVDHIVLLKINGYNHYVLILNITNESITLFDPNLGIISMNLTKFEDLFTGIVLVVNGSIANCTPLSDKLMKDIKGLWHYEWRTRYVYHPPKIYYKTIKIPYPVFSVKVVWKTGWFGVKYPTLQTSMRWSYYTIRVPYVKSLGWFQTIRYQVKVYDWKDVLTAGKWVYNGIKTAANIGSKVVTSAITNVGKAIISSTINTVKTYYDIGKAVVDTSVSVIKTIDKEIKQLESQGHNKIFMRMGADTLGGILMTGAVIAAATGVGLPVAIVLGTAGVILSAYGNGLFEDYTNLYNWGGFGTSVIGSLSGGWAIKPTVNGIKGAKYAVKVGYHATWITGDIGMGQTINLGWMGLEEFINRNF